VAVQSRHFIFHHPGESPRPLYQTWPGHRIKKRARKWKPPFSKRLGDQAMFYSVRSSRSGIAGCGFLFLRWARPDRPPRRTDCGLINLPTYAFRSPRCRATARQMPGYHTVITAWQIRRSFYNRGRALDQMGLDGRSIPPKPLGESTAGLPVGSFGYTMPGTFLRSFRKQGLRQRKRRDVPISSFLLDQATPPTPSTGHRGPTTFYPEARKYWADRVL